MGFFSNILEKLGLKKEEPAATSTPAPAQPAAAPVKPVAAPVKPAAPVASAAKPVITAEKGERDNLDSLRTAEPVVKAISEVDVMKKLEDMAKGSELDWKVSIVDMLKVLGIDSSREARNELATELGCPEDLMKDSAKMNVWLHKEVLKRIAANGGNIPKTMLD